MSLTRQVGALMLLDRVANSGKRQMFARPIVKDKGKEISAGDDDDDDDDNDEE